MRLKLIQLRSEPSSFKPLSFHDGVNIIMGERSENGEQDRKQNGVGKTMTVEFLRFALLAEFSKTRVSRIPDGILPEGTVIILDLVVNGEEMQIRRSIAEHDQPVLKRNGNETTFDSRLAAQEEITNCLFASDNNNQCSLRALLAILIRDERSGFQNILNPYDLSEKVPEDLRPHLTIMGISSSPFTEMTTAIASLASKQTAVRELKKTLLAGQVKKLEDIPVILNAEKSASTKIDAALKVLQADPAFESAEEELCTLERELRSQRAKRRALTFRIQQIESIPLAEQVSARDMRELFDGINDSLGEFVEKSFQQAREFQSKIEAYQFTLRKEELENLQKERATLSSSITRLSQRHGALAESVDREGVLKELEIGYDLAQKRSEDYYILKERYQQHQQFSQEIEELKIQRSTAIQSLRQNIDEAKETLNALNETIVSYHQAIQNSARAALNFTYSTSSTAKRPIGLNFKAQDDGSKSVNMVKVFIYDMALILNPSTRDNHPSLLIHDNILEVDQDTTEKILNHLGAIHKEDAKSFQYILTLNSDKVENAEAKENLSIDLDNLKIASLTKNTQFLGKRYEEVE